MSEITKFQCHRCGHEAKTKHNLKLHLQRTFPCKPKLDEIRPEILLNKLNEKPNARFQCKFCFRKYTHSSTKSQHQKNCKLRDGPLPEGEIREIITSLEDRIRDLERRPTTVINNNNTINNYTFDLVPYGHYSMDHIYTEMTIADFKRYLTQKDDAVGSLIEDKYFNPKYPQFQNISVDTANFRKGLVMVYKDDQWNTRDLNELLEEIIDSEITFLVTLCRNEMIDLSKQTLDEYASYFKSLNASDPKLKKKAGIILLNHA
jgi:hypothetical protein